MYRISPKYTEVLLNLLENEEAKAKIDEKMSTYPMYIPTSKNEYIPRIVPTREELNEAILNHYKYREIGFETFGRFLDELEIALKEIMPYYNQIFFTQDQDFNVIYNVDYQKTIERQRNENREDNTNTTSSASDTSTTNTTGQNNAKGVESDTPQSQLHISTMNIDSVSAGNKANWTQDINTSSANNTGSSNTTGTGNTTGTTEDNENILETTKGNFGVTSAQDLILKYRETILNTVQDIINNPRISELFMLVY